MLFYILLGALQGVFEWIPVSSEGIVALASQAAAGSVNPVDIAIFLHLGTLFAVLVYFRKDWADVLMLRNRKLARFLLVATAVSLTVGLPFYYVFRSVAVGSSLLLVTGFGLLLTSYFHKANNSWGIGTGRVAVVSGLLQGLSVIPGLSRSGSTIFGLSLGRLKPSEILKYSFMMSVPVILASGLYVLAANPVLVDGWPSLLSSFFVGLFSLHVLMRFSQRINFFRFTLVFAVLCFIGAVISFIV